MNNKQRALLAAVFATPVRRSIRWKDLRTLLEALGATVRAGEGSRVRVTLNNERATFHAPHPSPVVGVKTVVDIRKFLLRAGVVADG
jgi:HicA toxin of bacterial toxin-antitoxin,